MTVIPFRAPRKAYVLVDNDHDPDIPEEWYPTRERAEEVMSADGLGEREFRHIEERIVSEEFYSKLLAEVFPEFKFEV